ncbi:carph-isopro domain-containing protein [Novosphingobium sp. Leaf2]|uniref:carph-isopro domain-containing protein n=1 Tax=Novosphingobium sp. Leaf2 TaxID=1735670 RepID=UPI00138ECFCA|nr:hypothetical protein [Novosphingobium sp. Leaf2]
MNHQAIIADLGGIRALARKLGHNSHTTVQGWFDRNRIPLAKWPDVIAAAKEGGKEITTEKLLPADLRQDAA